MAIVSFASGNADIYLHKIIEKKEYTTTLMLNSFTPGLITEETLFYLLKLAVSPAAWWKSALFPDNLDQHPFFPAAVKLSVEDLLPGTEIQTPFSHGHHHFPSHDLPLHVGVGVVLAHIMPVS